MSCCKTYDPCLDGKLNQIGSYAAAARSSAQNSANSAAQSSNSATSAAESAAQAAASAALSGIYLGSFAVAPTTDNTGGPLQEGMLYYNTVSNGLFVWNGSVWTSADFNEFTNFIATGTITPRNLVTRFADIVNVSDFGASPSASATVNTAAIQAALNYAATIVQNVIPNKVDIVKAKVFIPSGIYQTNATLIIGEGVTLEGASQSTSIIKPTHTGVAIQMGGNAREYSQICVRNIGILGNISGTLTYGNWTTTTTVGIYAENCIRECSIENCFITQCQTSIKTENSYAFEINTNYLVYALDYHIEADNLVAGSISGNRIDWSEKHGIYINGTNAGDETIALDIESNAIQICWRNGLWLYDVSSATVQNNFFEANYREAVDGTTHVYADINIEKGPNSRGYSFNVIGNFFTHGSSPNVDAYTAIRCNKAICLNATGNTCRDSFYWRFIDANTSDVKRIIALGNSYEGTFTKIAYSSSTAFGIIEEQLADGSINIPNLYSGTNTAGTTVSSSSQTTSEFRTIYLINCSGGGRQVNLRDVDCVAGRIYIIKKTDSGANNITVIPEVGSTKTIDGAPSISSSSAYAVIRITSDGTNWFTL